MLTPSQRETFPCVTEAIRRSAPEIRSPNAIFRSYCISHCAPNPRRSTACRISRGAKPANSAIKNRLSPETQNPALLPQPPVPNPQPPSILSNLAAWANAATHKGPEHRKGRSAASDRIPAHTCADFADCDCQGVDWKRRGLLPVAPLMSRDRQRQCHGWRAAPHRTRLATLPKIQSGGFKYGLRPSRKKEMQMKIHLTWIRATAAAAIAAVGVDGHVACAQQYAPYGAAPQPYSAQLPYAAPQQQYAAPQPYAAQQPYAAPQQQYPTTQYPQTAAYGTPAYGDSGSCTCLHHAARSADRLHAAGPTTFLHGPSAATADCTTISATATGLPTNGDATNLSRASAERHAHASRRRIAPHARPNDRRKHG